MDEFNKRSIVPLQWVSERLSLPVKLSEDLSVERVSETLKPQHFDLWRDYLSAQEKDDLPRIDVGIVHRFFSKEHIGMPEERSKKYVYRLFLALRLIKPTRSRFSVIQYKITDDGAVDVFSFTHPDPALINSPDCESVNRVEDSDLVYLQQIFPRFELLSANGPEHLRRAVRYYEMGYGSIQEPEIQFLTWAMGIEAAVVSEEEKFPRRREVVDRVLALVPADTVVYADSPLNEFVNFPDLTVGEALPEILLLRSRLAHGQWFTGRKPEVTRKTLSSSTLNYEEMLREAAPFILRRVILAKLEQNAS